jgi:hypothetical protein
VAPAAAKESSLALEAEIACICLATLDRRGTEAELTRHQCLLIHDVASDDRQLRVETEKV